MIIKKLRIKNYKSIIDSGDCYIEEDLTIFAGKNESGKTSILEALEDFNTDKSISDKAKPIGKENKLPEITLTIQLTPEELIEYYRNIEIEKTITEEQEIEITKTYPNIYSVSEATESLLGLDGEKYILNKKNKDKEKQNIEEEVDRVYQQLKQIHLRYLRDRRFFPLNLRDIEATRNYLNVVIKNYLKNNKNILPSQNIRNAYEKCLQKLPHLLDELQNQERNEKKKEVENWEYLFELIPNFILFNSFDDILPNEVSFTNLEENEFIKDLEIISNLDVNVIKSDDKRKKGIHKRDINVALNEEYSQFWIQDLTKINVDWDSDSLQFWIEEDEQLYRPSERSKGKQWHMSFYTKVTARALEERTNVILIDEPGLFLHAAAQKDIYKKLIDRSKRSQVLFTTHSPYLIDRNELHRIRLVIKESSKKIKTRIENKIHARADKETLTPILTAIGLGLSDGIQNINQENNIIVEGPSDYFYLQGFKIVLKEKIPNIVFGGGAGNMGKVGAILTGWGCNVVYLFDTDKGKKDGIKNLTKTWLIEEKFICSIKDDTGTIEDLFSKGDFKKYILQDNKAKIEISNSDFIKKNKIDKVLLAKQFNAFCHNEEVKLTQETTDLVKKLFQKLKRKFLPTNEEVKNG